MADFRCLNDPKHKIILVEYGYEEPEHYDGISEIECLVCKMRWGRWTGKELSGSEREPRFGIPQDLIERIKRAMGKTIVTPPERKTGKPKRKK
jgi:hypothetical protein